MSHGLSGCGSAVPFRARGSSSALRVSLHCVRDHLKCLSALRGCADELVEIKGFPVLKHEVDGATQLAGEDGVAFELAVLRFEASGVGVEIFVVAFAKHGGLTEGPSQIGVAELGPPEALDLAGTGDGALDEATVAEEVLRGGKTVDGLDFVENGQSQGLADAGDGAQQGEVARLFPFGDSEEFLFQLLDGVVVLNDQLDILLKGKTLTGVFGGFEEGLEPFLAVVAELGDRTIAPGHLAGADALEQFDALPDIGGALTEEVSHGALGGRVDVGRRDQIAAQKVGEFFGVNAVIFVFTAVDGL